MDDNNSVGGFGPDSFAGGSIHPTPSLTPGPVGYREHSASQYKSVTAKHQLYTGNEPGQPLLSSPLHVTNETFFIPIRSLPSNAKPIIDEESGECVGFVSDMANVWHFYDIAGLEVKIYEPPLEKPFIDPLDLLFIGEVGFKLIRAGIRVIARSTAELVAISTLTKTINKEILPILRSRLRGFSSAKGLKFTDVTARHMNEPGRFVPVNILRLAIKYGKRTGDPKSFTHVFRYETPMSRIVKRITKSGGEEYVRATYTLEVVVRESDWTIIHFMYY